MAEAIVYVSPNGRDSNPGTVTEPVRSLDDALNRIRSADADAKRIVVREGNYYDVHLTLTAEDSGLVIEAYPGERPVLYGGMPITAWEREGDCLTAKLDGVRERMRDFRVIEANGEDRPRARLPEAGFFRHRNEFDVRWMTTLAGGWERKPTESELSVLKYEEGDLGPWLDTNNAELTMYHEWDESLVGLHCIDPEAGTVTFSNKPGHPPGAFADRNPNANNYVVWNVREGITKPGQWVLDRTNGKLVYRPLPSESEENLHVVAPSRNRIFHLEKGAERLRFHGLTLACSATGLTAGGFGAVEAGAAFEGEGVKDIALERMAIRHTGGWAVRLKGDRIRIESCHIHHTGAGGIHVVGEGNALANCRLHDVGLTYQSAVAVLCGGKNNVLSHNDVSNTPYSGMIVFSSDTAVEGNLFDNVMTFMKDGAAVYCTGVSGVTIAGNAVFGRPGVKTRSYAYYLDELCDHCTVEGNLAVNIGLPALSHMTKHCRYVHNVFLDQGPQIIAAFNTFGLVFERNVLAAERIEFQAPRGNPDRLGSDFVTLDILKPYSAADGIVSLKGNLFDSKSGTAVFKELVQYKPVRELALNEIAPENRFEASGLRMNPDGSLAFDGNLPEAMPGIRTLSFADAGCTGSFAERLKQSGFSFNQD